MSTANSIAYSTCVCERPCQFQRRFYQAALPNWSDLHGNDFQIVSSITSTVIANIHMGIIKCTRTMEAQSHTIIKINSQVLTGTGNTNFESSYAITTRSYTTKLLPVEHTCLSQIHSTHTPPLSHIRSFTIMVQRIPNTEFNPDAVSSQVEVCVYA